jgi:hypothetical protein
VFVTETTTLTALPWHTGSGSAVRRLPSSAAGDPKSTDTDAAAHGTLHGFVPVAVAVNAVLPHPETE